MNFYLKNTASYQVVKLSKCFLFGWSRQLRKIFFWLFWIGVVLFLIKPFVSSIKFFNISDEQIVGLVFLFLGGYFLFLEISHFFYNRLANPHLKVTLQEAASRPEDYNLASFLDVEATRYIAQSAGFIKKKKIKEISNEILLFNILKSKNNLVRFVFSRAPLPYKTLKKELKLRISQNKNAWLPSIEKTITRALQIASERKKQYIGVGDILIALSQEFPFFENFLILNDFKSQDIQNLVDWYERIINRLKKRKKFWLMENLLRYGGVGREWAAGYSLLLDEFSTELTYPRTIREIVGHQKEIEEVERILSSDEENNVLIVGEEGTGRQSIVEAIVQKAFLGQSTEQINFKRFLMLDISRIVATAHSFKEAESLVEQCFAEVLEAGNIILIINNIHDYLQKGKASSEKAFGSIDISPILARYLALNEFRLIGITTFRAFHTIIETNPSVLNLFKKVEAEEISETETLNLLENFLPYFETKYKKFVFYKALREIIILSAKFIQDSPFPEKAIRILDEAMSYLALHKNERFLTEHHIKHLITEKTEIPLEELESKEKENLLYLENLIHERIIDQEEAVKQVSNALRRARAEIKTKRGPIGSFLFLGPTGVGKTETAKALAAIYFGSEKRMIRLDMSEFQQVNDIKRLLGKSGEEGLLTTPVREKPFSLLLLDEIEKAHPNILNLFLQILDEGWVTSGNGRKVSFKNTMIIATSNAGAEFIRERVIEGIPVSQITPDLLDYLLEKGIFRPEFINRFDAVVVYKPLSKTDLLAIAGLLLKKLVQNLQDKGVRFQVTPSLKQKIVEWGYSPEFGARQMRRVIQDKVENLLAKALLSGKIKRGDTIRIKVEGEKLTLEISHLKDKFSL